MRKPRFQLNQPISYSPEKLSLWVDDWILAIQKPAGLPSLPDGYDPQAPHVVSVFEPVFGKLWIVHRLDRNTSGVMLLARTPEIHRELSMAFENQVISKYYHVLVDGLPPWETFEIQLSLRPDGDRKHRTVVDPQVGKYAATRFRVLERFRWYALLEAQPLTGRTHQIRVHLASHGLPVVADPLYGTGAGIYLSQLKPGFRIGKAGECALLARLGLHARKISILHPVTGDVLEIEAPYAKDFNAALRQLRKYSSLDPLAGRVRLL